MQTYPSLLDIKIYANYQSLRACDLRTLVLLCHGLVSPHNSV